MRPHHRTTVRHAARRWLVALAAVGLLAACSEQNQSDGDTGTSPATTDAAPTTTVATEADADTIAAVQAAIDGDAAGCDPLDTKRCLLPFPSNAYAVTDPATATGLRVTFPEGSLGANIDGVAIDVTEWNRNDGFSPNTELLTYFAGLDPTASNLPSWTDIGASLEADSTVVLVDILSGERVPLWAEVDSQADSDEDRLLSIRPAVALAEGHTYAVGIRGMVDSTGAPIEPGDAFRVYRDALLTGIDSIEARRPAMEAALTALTDAGIDRTGLQLAWEFTVASTENIAGRMLHIRDDALAALGDGAPAYTVTEVVPNAEDGIALQVRGTFTVPNYLTGDGGPGNAFNYADDGPDALPTMNGTLEAPFMCNISTATMNGSEPAHLVQYGHGLLGGHDEINAGNVRNMSNEHNAVYCATKWAGMSEDDIGNAAATLGGFGNFRTIADRLQQGVLNQIFLGRLMTRLGGLVDDPNFQRADGTPLIDVAHLDYDGNSQGGIMGLMLAAVSPDIERAVLGVPGMNYSLLLPRSVDWATYNAIFAPAYPNELDRTVILAAVQMLWDRGEGAGYAQHVTSDPYEGTDAKTVLLHVAFGDHQVSELSAMVEARTLGIPIHRPVAADGRWQEAEPGWGLDDLSYPSAGSAIIVWDSGMAPIPFENVAPAVGDDSHEDPRADADVRVQKASFLFEDTLIDVCGGAACTADHRE